MLITDFTILLYLTNECRRKLAALFIFHMRFKGETNKNPSRDPRHNHKMTEGSTYVSCVKIRVVAETGDFLWRSSLETCS